MSGPRKRLSAGERRNQLIDVGRAVFAEHGYDASSVEQIAEKAEISKPIIYEHFGGKEGLYAAIVEREMEYVVENITAAISVGSPLERLENAVMSFLSYVKEHPDGFAVMSRDSPNLGMANLLAEVADRVSKIFASEFRRAGYDPDAAPIYAQALVGMVTFVGQWWRDNPERSAPDVASHVIALSWMGLRHLPNRPNRPDG